jgi:hypothetical protein
VQRREARNLRCQQSGHHPNEKQVYALEWGELVLLFDGTPKVSAGGRSRK